MKGGISFRRKIIDGDCYKCYFYLLRLKGENCLKRLIPKNVGSLKKQIVEKFDSDRKKINLISTKSFKYLNQYFSMHDRKKLIFHNIFIFLFFYDLRVTFKKRIPLSRIFFILWNINNIRMLRKNERLRVVIFVWFVRNLVDPSRTFWICMNVTFFGMTRF